MNPHVNSDEAQCSIVTQKNGRQSRDSVKSVYEVKFVR